MYQEPTSGRANRSLQHTDQSRVIRWASFVDGIRWIKEYPDRASGVAGFVLILLLVTVGVMSRGSGMWEQIEGMGVWGAVWVFLILAIMMALIVLFIRGAGRR